MTSVAPVTSGRWLEPLPLLLLLGCLYAIAVLVPSVYRELFAERIQATVVDHVQRERWLYAVVALPPTAQQPPRRIILTKPGLRHAQGTQVTLLSSADPSDPLFEPSPYAPAWLLFFLAYSLVLLMVLHGSRMRRARQAAWGMGLMLGLPGLLAMIVAGEIVRQRVGLLLRGVETEAVVLAWDSRYDGSQRNSHDDGDEVVAFLAAAPAREIQVALYDPDVDGHAWIGTRQRLRYLADDPNQTLLLPEARWKLWVAPIVWAALGLVLVLLAMLFLPRRKRALGGRA